MTLAKPEKKILLMDDEKDIREVLEVILVNMGYTVFTAENGQKGLDIFQEELPQIVITDIKMPGLSGIDVLKKIKADHPDTEVIMITGHGDNELAIKSLKHKAIDFITKPISDDDLEIALKRANDKIITRNQLSEYTRNLELLLKEKIELQDHLSSLGLMIGSISHGIKGLLTRLDGGVYLIDSACTSQKLEDVDEGLDILKETVQRIKKMVLDILYYSKKRGLTLKETDVAAFSRDVVNAVEQKIKDHDIILHLDLGADPFNCRIDRELLHTALLNILDNAVDACRDDDTKSSHTITFAIRQDRKYLYFNISDNGIGMDSKIQKQIFNLCYSAKGSKGTGFGLFITHDIVRNHQGSISLNSSVGSGTEFTIKIPKKIKQAEVQ